MKGGITSGVIYPLAVCELSKAYRLRNVGGTSAGAIAAAAAAAAAAEHGRDACSRGNGSPGMGFQGLAELPDWIGRDGHLLRLFQPASATAPLLKLLLSVIRRRGGWFKRVRRALAILARLARAGMFSRYFFLPLIGIVPAAGLVIASDASAADWALGLALLGVTIVGLTSLATILRRPRKADPLSLAPCEDLQRLNSAHAKSRRAWGLRAAGATLWLSLAVGSGLLVQRAAQDPKVAWGSAAVWLVAILGVVVGAVGAVVLDAGRSLPANLFGLVTGSTVGTPSSQRASDDVAPLSDWLTELLDKLAGCKDHPLTFGALWNGAGDVREDAACQPSVNLEMLTTCLTKGRPYRLPNDLGRNWFYDPTEFEQIFPHCVVKHLYEYRHPAMLDSDEQGDWEELVQLASQAGLRPLPDPAGLPVVLAARMSLSFPFLISAVPLYGVDRSCLGPKGEPRLERCWFSDGGITSNFPVSFFDKLLPTRPTFGINLRPFHPAYPQSTIESENVYMPESNRSGILDWWQRPSSTRGIGAVVGFAASILDTMQNWIDNQQLHVPGFRDRIVHVSHNEDEGGMNLNMPEDVLAKLAGRGKAAGARLVEFYTSPPSEDRVVSWENHRRVRLRSSLAILQGQLIDLSKAHLKVYEADLASDSDPPSYDWTSHEQRALARSLIEGIAPAMEGGDYTLWGAGLAGIGGALAGIAERQTPSDLAAKAPSPTPQLNITPGHKASCEE